MLRINVHNGGQVQVIELAGRVIGPWVEELRVLCHKARRDYPAIRLDLKQVAFVDSSGAQLLLKLRAEQVELAHCTRFVEEQLRIAAGVTSTGET